MNDTARRAQKERDFQKTLFPDRQSWLREYLTDEDKVKHLLRVLVCHTPEDRTDCWPSVATITREMSLKSTRTTQRVIKLAEREGLIVVLPPKRGRKTNTYRLRIPEIREAARLEKLIRDRWNANLDDCQERFSGNYKAYLDDAKQRDLSPHPRQPCHPTHDSGVTPPMTVVSPKTSIETSIETPSKHGGDGVWKNAGGWDEPITVEQMTKADWCQKRYEEAVRKNWIVGSETNRIRFFALSRACRYRRGIDHPGKFFSSCLKGEKWNFIRNEDDDAARKAIRALDHVSNEIPVGIPVFAIPAECRDKSAAQKIREYHDQFPEAKGNS